MSGLDQQIETLRSLGTAELRQEWQRIWKEPAPRLGHVAEAYGWPANLSDEAILTRLVALNKERAAEEAKGLIRWLRPEYQAPDYAPPVTQTLDLGDIAPVIPDNIIPWPGSLPEQVSAVQRILAAAPTPLAPHDVARAFKGKRASTVEPVLQALAGIGIARRLEDGRYAA